jgi:hypothetical protein
MQDGGLHRYFLALFLVVPPTLSQLQQFANLGHADVAIAEQVIGDRALRGIFR